MKELTLLEILSDVMNGPERPSQQPDGAHCLATLEFLESLPIQTHKILIHIQVIITEKELLMKTSSDEEDQSLTDEENARLDSLSITHETLTELIWDYFEKMDPEDHPQYSSNAVKAIIEQSIPSFYNFDSELLEVSEDEVTFANSVKTTPLDS